MIEVSGVGGDMFEDLYVGSINIIYCNLFVFLFMCNLVNVSKVRAWNHD